MKKDLKLMRIVWVAAGLLVALAPTSALAHENVGGDELAVANWMLVGAIITIVMGIIAGVWAIRTGQFNNVEESKFTMLATAENYDAILAEVERAEQAARAAQAAEALKAASARQEAAQPVQKAERAGAARA
jgi:nitrogen fixation-related uncharacterized protein